VDWHEDESFWDEFYPAMYHEGRWAVAEEEASQISNLLGLSEGDSVLDICCGPGRHSLAFARRGFKAVGVDRTSTYLDMGRELAADEGLEVEFILEDAREYQGEVRYDAAVCLYTSIGYFDTPEEDRRLLEKACQSLKPGGRLLMDLSGKEVLARVFKEQNRTELADGTVFLEERTIEGDWERVHNRWVLVQDEKRIERRFSVRIYSGSGLKAMMLESGFESVNLYGTLDGRPYDFDARRLVAVGRRGPNDLAE
jgi:SAM-dependent methyltransferase